MAFSDMVQSFRNAAIEKGKSSAFSVSGGNFLTYCQVSEHGTAFLVHVPDLRKFTSGAKATMAEAAWAAAQLVAESQNPAPRKLAVAVRGALLYDQIMIGNLVPGFTNEGNKGIVSRHASSDSEVLHPFFASPTLPVTLVIPGDPKFAREATKRSTPPAREPSPQPERMPPTQAPAQGTAQTVAPTAPAPAAAPAVVAVHPAVTAMLPTPVREWKSADGRSLRASLVRFADDKGAQAEFKREDGTVFNIEVSKFSAEDRIELLRLFTASTTPVSP
jgi:hypothetical protein